MRGDFEVNFVRVKSKREALDKIRRELLATKTIFALFIRCSTVEHGAFLFLFKICNFIAVLHVIAYSLRS